MNPIRRLILFLSILFLTQLQAQDPPANNTYQTAATLTVQAQSCSSHIQGDLTHATNSNGSDYSSACLNGIRQYEEVAYADLWYKATVPSSGNLNVQISAVSGSPLTDPMLFAYTLAEDVLTEIDCTHDSNTDYLSVIRLTGQAENTEVYFMVAEASQVKGHDFGSDLGAFQICALDPDLTPPANDDPEDAIALTVYEVSSCTADQQITGTFENATHSGYAFDPEFCGSSGITTPFDVWYKLTVPDSGSFTVRGFVEKVGETTLFINLYTLNNEVYTRFNCGFNGSGITTSNREAGEVIYIQLISASQVWGYNDNLQSSIINICAFDASSLTNTPTAKPMLSYYSNPMGNRLRVESPYNIQSLAVYDLVGREVLTKSPQKQKLTLDTYSLAPGVYLLNVQTAEGQQTVKLIKN